VESLVGNVARCACGAAQQSDDSLLIEDIRDVHLDRRAQVTADLEAIERENVVPGVDQDNLVIQ